MKKLISGLSLILLLSGCVHFNKRIPCLDEFYELCDEKTMLNVNDCSNKSGKLVRELRKKGYDADIIVIDDDQKDSMAHAVARVKFRGKYFYMDPTWKKCYWEIPKDFRFIRKVENLELDHSIEFREIISYPSSPIK